MSPILCRIKKFREKKLVNPLSKLNRFYLHLIMTLIDFLVGSEAVTNASFASSNLNRCVIKRVTSILAEATSSMASGYLQLIGIVKITKFSSFVKFKAA